MAWSSPPCVATSPARTRSIALLQGLYRRIVQSDTLGLAERAKGEDSILPLARLPHVMFFGGGVPIKLGDETIGAIGAAGAPGGQLDDACARAGIDKIKDRLQ